MDNLLNNEYIGLYFFSAVFQGNMALLALTGVFVVFRLQLIDQEIASTFQQMKQHVLSRSSGGENEMVVRLADVHSSSQLMKRLGELAEMKPVTVADGPIKGLAFEIRGRNELVGLSSRSEDLQKFRERTVSAMRIPFILTATISVVSVILLPLIHYVDKTSHTTEAALIVLTLVLQGFVLWKTAQFTFDVVSRKTHVRVWSGNQPFV
jgi:hypothetical protein